MSICSDIYDDDPRERPGYDDPEHCEVPPGDASGFLDDWWEPQDEPREWPQHDPEAQSKCHGWRVTR